EGGISMSSMVVTEGLQCFGLMFEAREKPYRFAADQIGSFVGQWLKGVRVVSCVEVLAQEVYEVVISIHSTQRRGDVLDFTPAILEFWLMEPPVKPPIPLRNLKLFRVRAKG